MTGSKSAVLPIKFAFDQREGNVQSIEKKTSDGFYFERWPSST